MDYHGGFGCFIWTWERILRKQFWIGSNFLLYTQAADAENSTKCNQIEQVRLGYGSIPINTNFRGMNIHKSQLQYFDVNYRGTLGDLTHLHKVSPLSPKTSTDQQMLRLCTSRVAGSGQVGRAQSSRPDRGVYLASWGCWTFLGRGTGMALNSYKWVYNDIWYIMIYIDII
jgi:hypothetical protein